MCVETGELGPYSYVKSVNLRHCDSVHGADTPFTLPRDTFGAAVIQRFCNIYVGEAALIRSSARGHVSGGLL